MLTGLSLFLWYAAILSKVTVLTLLLGRVRMPLFAFACYMTASAFRSLYLVTLQNDLVAYKATLTATEPWMRMFAAAVFIEAFLWLSYRLVGRFRPLMIGAFCGLCALAAGVWAASGVALEWRILTSLDYLAALERSSGLALAVVFGIAAFAGEPWQDVDRRALHHAAALCLANAGVAVAYVVFKLTGGAYEPLSSIISSGSALIAYGLVWCWYVGRFNEPQMPAIRQAA